MISLGSSGGMYVTGATLFSGPELAETFTLFTYKAILRKVVRRNVHATTPKGNMGYDQYTVLDTVALEPTFVALI